MNFGVIVHPFLYCFIINWINAFIKKKKKKSKKDHFYPVGFIQNEFSYCIFSSIFFFFSFVAVSGS